ncbi:MAG: GNAT family N-acetyltransferase [Oscillospiraceae bacterium]
MPHIGTQKIETERLILRPFLPQDAEAAFLGWTNDPEVARWMRWEPHKSAEETLAAINRWVAAYQDPTYYHWGIQRKTDGALMGAIGIFTAGEESSLAEWEPGYCIGQAYWGNGYTLEALQAILNFFINVTGITSIGCSHAEQNPASGKVMQKVGFVYHSPCICHRLDGSPMPSLYYLYNPS